MAILSLIHPLLAIVLAPLLLGVINRTKAVFAGRAGQPLLQAYYDIAKLLRKGTVYSRTTTWIFRAGPIVGLACALVATMMLPFGGVPALFAFPGDVVLLVYLLGLMRFFTVLAALDTGSSFEGMGAGRELAFSALAEPVLLLSLAVVARKTGSFCLSTMFAHTTPQLLTTAAPAIVLVLIALMVVVLAENARIPVDDPNTHLELTMIHEVMVLDHSGPDFAFIGYAAALKLWVLGTILVRIGLPLQDAGPPAAAFTNLAALLILAVVIGVIESCMARLRLTRVPHLIVGAGAAAVVALVLVLR